MDCPLFSSLPPPLPQWPHQFVTQLGAQLSHNGRGQGYANTVTKATSLEGFAKAIKVSPLLYNALADPNKLRHIVPQSSPFKRPFVNKIDLGATPRPPPIQAGWNNSQQVVQSQESRRGAQMYRHFQHNKGQLGRRRKGSWADGAGVWLLCALLYHLKVSETGWGSMVLGAVHPRGPTESTMEV